MQFLANLDNMYMLHLYISAENASLKALKQAVTKEEKSYLEGMALQMKSLLEQTNTFPGVAIA